MAPFFLLLLLIIILCPVWLLLLTPGAQPGAGHCSEPPMTQPRLQTQLSQAQTAWNGLPCPPPSPRRISALIDCKPQGQLPKTSVRISLAQTLAGTALGETQRLPQDLDAGTQHIYPLETISVCLLHNKNTARQIPVNKGGKMGQQIVTENRPISEK